MKGVQCYELFGGIAKITHVHFIFISVRTNHGGFAEISDQIVDVEHEE